MAFTVIVVENVRKYCLDYLTQQLWLQVISDVYFGEVAVCKFVVLLECKDHITAQLMERVKLET